MSGFIAGYGGVPNGAFDGPPDLLADERIMRACAAFDGELWVTFNASLFWQIRHALEAADGLPCTCQTPEAARQSERVGDLAPRSHGVGTGGQARADDLSPEPSTDSPEELA